MEPTSHEASHHLLEEIEHLKKEVRDKSDFIAIMSHQLRTSLTANKWIMSMMLEGDLGTFSEHEKSMIARGLQNNQQMIRMLADISQANHVTEWKLTYDFQPIDLAPCILSAHEAFQGEARTKNITFSYFQHGHLPLVMADREKMCLVIQNLIENGIKYNIPGGSLTLRTETTAHQLIISVTDTGMGIPLENQTHIFSKFYRGDNARAHEPGTGLGLFIVKQIIEEHHGSIWFESIPDKGTTFFVALPLAGKVS
jgi:two-component system sensor histidine kinase VicK